MKKGPPFVAAELKTGPRFRAKRGEPERLQVLSPGSEGQNQAVTVVYVAHLRPRPRLLDRGRIAPSRRRSRRTLHGGVLGVQHHFPVSGLSSSQHAGCVVAGAPQIWCARALSRSKSDEIVPHTQHVDLRIVQTKWTEGSHLSIKGLAAPALHVRVLGVQYRYPVSRLSSGQHAGCEVQTRQHWSGKEPGRTKSLRPKSVRQSWRKTSPHQVSELK